MDQAPTGDIDIAPTLAHIPGIEMPSVGMLKGRVLNEALKESVTAPAGEIKTIVSEPATDGTRTLLEYQDIQGVRYYDHACLLMDSSKSRCE